MENKQNLDKQELSASLLSVRAGLSAISNIHDEIREEEKNISDAKHKISCREGDIKRLETAIDANKSNNAHFRAKIQEEKKEIEFKKTCIRNEKFSPLEFFINLWPGGIISLAILIFSLIGTVSCAGGSADSVEGPGFILSLMCLIVSIVVFVCFLIRALIKTHRDTADSIATYSRDVNRIQGDIWYNEDGIRKIEKEIIRMKQQIVIYQQEKQVAEKELPVIEEKCKNKIAELKDTAKAIAMGLNMKYGNIISESDWENLDLVVHYLNTGRADSIKEALYQVDRQRQNDALVSAIKSSSNAICSHIQMATQTLSYKLDNNFSMLQSTINSGINNYIKSSKEQSDRLLSSVNEQIESSKMTNALLEKANQTSLELYRDYKYVNEL